MVLELLALDLLAMEDSDLLTLSVPSEQEPRLREALNELRRTRDESRLERLIADLDALSARSGTLQITGPRDLLREGLLVAIDELGDSLSERCTQLLRGAGSPAELREDVRGLDELLALLVSIEQPG